MAEKQYQVGVIRYELSAKIFPIPFILTSKNFELGAIVQRSGSSAAQDHPAVKVYRTPDDLFNDETIDVIVVSTPPSTHFTLASAALNARKHVIAENPFCPSTQEFDELIALAESNQIVALAATIVDDVHSTERVRFKVRKDGLIEL